MSIPRRVGGARDHLRRVAGRGPLGRLGALECPALGDVVGVPRVGGHREAGSFGQPRQRADQRLRQLAVLVRVEQDLVDVPVGVVVGEDRGAQILLPAGRLQVSRGGADRIDRVVGVLAPVLVGVDAVHVPRRGDELHPTEGAGGGDVQVRPEGGLDPVDRGEHLPRDPVLGPAGLVDRQQERRDRELVDDEVRNPKRRRTEVGDRDGGVRRGRGAVRAAQRRGLRDGVGGRLPLVVPGSAVAVVPAVPAAVAPGAAVAAASRPDGPFGGRDGGVVLRTVVRGRRGGCLARRRRFWRGVIASRQVDAGPAGEVDVGVPPAPAASRQLDPTAARQGRSPAAVLVGQVDTAAARKVDVISVRASSRQQLRARCSGREAGHQHRDPHYESCLPGHCLPGHPLFATTFGSPSVPDRLPGLYPACAGRNEARVGAR